MEAIPFAQSVFRRMLDPDLRGFSGSLDEFREHSADFSRWLGGLQEEALDHAYAPGKWTAREVLGHVVDTHVILSFRILSFGRGEIQPLPGADEGLWTRLSGHSWLPKSELIRGYRSAAGLSAWITETLPQAALERSGVANGVLLTVRELIAYLPAHERHHRRILRELYGIG